MALIVRRFANLRTAATYNMNRYMPLTGHDSTTPSLLIDIQVPLDVLHNAAVYRIRAVTHVMENLAFREGLQTDTIVLQDFALFRCAMAVICWM